jgi:RNA polymerase sigma factor (sigma-70 family)
VPLTFAGFVSLLRQPPFEPCESELQFLTPAEYVTAFNEAVRLYYRPIIYHIARITGDKDEAADLAQGLFLSLYRKRVSFEKAYIYRAARNTAYSELRRRGRENRLLHALRARASRAGRWKQSQEFDLPDTRPLPDEELFERARQEALKLAVERLPEPFRTPLLLLAADNSYERIMEVTQAVEGTVKSRICRGKSILRRRLHAYL